MANEYIINSILESSITKFQEAKKKRDEDYELHHKEFEIVQAELAKLFYILSDNIINAFKFKLIDKEDALQEGVMICLQKLDQFKPERGKAFNYYTTCTLNHFRQLYRGAKSQHELQKRYYEHLIDQLEGMFFDHGSYGQLKGGYKGAKTAHNKS